MPVILILALLFGGGTSAFAERALPGDVLYPVKINVNERVADLFAVSTGSQAQFDAAMATRRLQEAEQLAAQARLDASAQAQLAANFNQHANGVQTEVKNFGQQNAQQALAISSDFEATLGAHKRILTAIAQAKDGVTLDEALKLLASISTEQDDTKQDVHNSEDVVKGQKGTEVQKAAQEKMNEVQHKIGEVQSFINEKSVELGAQAVGQAQARLQVASDTVAQGKTQLDAGAYGNAFVLFQQAQNIAQESKLLVQGKIDFEERDNESETPHPEDNASSTEKLNASSTGSFRVRVQSEDDGKAGSDEGGHAQASSSVQLQGGIHIDLGGGNDD